MNSASGKRVLVVEAARDVVAAIESWAAVHNIVVVQNPRGGLAELPLAAICSIDGEADDRLAEFRVRWPDTTVVAVGTDCATADIVASFRAGADDFLANPIDPTTLAQVIERSSRSRVAPVCIDVKPGEALELLRSSTNSEMIRITQLVEKVAATDIAVLIRGESGTGKELVARALHERSDRAAGPFVKVNCAALPSELLESELFGFERGAFTGAQKRKLGKFEHAEGGTIFLDEIGEMAPQLQAKLLQVLQDGEFSRLGGQQDVRVDSRIITATNRDLEMAVSRGEFREDLYYRVNVVTLSLPPLRSRREDILPLARSFGERFAIEYNQDEWTLSAEDLALLENHSWPGNVRELENVLRRLVVLGGSLDLKAELRPAETDSALHKALPETPIEGEALDLKAIGRAAARGAERAVMERVLDQTRWNRKEAAKRLSISYKALLYKIRETGLREAH